LPLGLMRVVCHCSRIWARGGRAAILYTVTPAPPAHARVRRCALVGATAVGRRASQVLTHQRDHRDGARVALRAHQRRWPVRNSPRPVRTLRRRRQPWGGGLRRYLNGNAIGGTVPASLSALTKLSALCAAPPLLSCRALWAHVGDRRPSARDRGRPAACVAARGVALMRRCALCGKPAAAATLGGYPGGRLPWGAATLGGGDCGSHLCDHRRLFGAARRPSVSVCCVG
jgi:hypothetical protein